MVRITPKVAMASIMLVLLLTSSCFLIHANRSLLQVKNQHQLQIEDDNKADMNNKHHGCPRDSYSCWKIDADAGNNH